MLSVLLAVTAMPWKFVFVGIDTVGWFWAEPLAEGESPFLTRLSERPVAPAPSVITALLLFGSSSCQELFESRWATYCPPSTRLPIGVPPPALYTTVSPSTKSGLYGRL